MTEEKTVLTERAETIVREITALMEERRDFSDAGALVSRLFDYVAEGDRDLCRDIYIQRFVFDAAQTIATKPWEKESDIYEKLPPYGFRGDEETLRWAQFGSHRKRTLSVNRFLIECRATQIRQSVHEYDVRDISARAEISCGEGDRVSQGRREMAVEFLAAPLGTRSLFPEDVPRRTVADCRRLRRFWFCVSRYPIAK
jgi:hypothetical protein